MTPRAARCTRTPSRREEAGRPSGRTGVRVRERALQSLNPSKSPLPHRSCSCDFTCRGNTNTVLEMISQPPHCAWMRCCCREFFLIGEGAHERTTNCALPLHTTGRAGGSNEYTLAHSVAGALHCHGGHCRDGRTDSLLPGVRCQTRQLGAQGFWFLFFSFSFAVPARARRV